MTPENNESSGEMSPMDMDLRDRLQRLHPRLRPRAVTLSRSFWRLKLEGDELLSMMCQRVNTPKFTAMQRELDDSAFIAYCDSTMLSICLDQRRSAIAEGERVQRMAGMAPNQPNSNQPLKTAMINEMFDHAKERSAPRDWEVFELYYLKGKSADYVCKSMSMSKASFYRRRQTVMQLLWEAAKTVLDIVL